MERTHVPEELLFRWDDQGNLQGVHYKEIEIWSDGGVVKRRYELDPRPITAEEAHALLGACHGDLLALTTSQAEAIALRDAQLAEGEHALAAEMNTVATLTAALAEATAQRDALQERLNLLMPPPA